jgi:hypothetical protein
VLQRLASEKRPESTLKDLRGALDRYGMLLDRRDDETNKVEDERDGKLRP